MNQIDETNGFEDSPVSAGVSIQVQPQPSPTKATRTPTAAERKDTKISVTNAQSNKKGLQQQQQLQKSPVLSAASSEGAPVLSQETPSVNSRLFKYSHQQSSLYSSAAYLKSQKRGTKRQHRGALSVADRAVQNENVSAMPNQKNALDNKKNEENSMSAFISEELEEYLASSSKLKIPFLNDIDPSTIPLPPDSKVLSIEKLEKWLAAREEREQQKKKDKEQNGQQNKEPNGKMGQHK